MTDRLVAGMVGGGPGAMIGAAHRHARWLDNQYILAAGIFGRQPQASAEIDQWRMDPDIGGAASAVCDVGTHAFHLLRYITGLEATRVSAELSTLVPGRRVFDNAAIRVTLSNGAPATVWATMAATGHEHGRCIRVFGDD